MTMKLKKTVLTCTLIASAIAGTISHADTLSRSQLLGTMDHRATVAIQRAPQLFVPAVFAVQCEVSGSPVEFPNDIRIWSGAGIAAGTQVSWNTPGFAGTVVLPELAPGEKAFLSNVLPGGLPAGSPCQASAI